jgi:hypothetical protein
LPYDTSGKFLREISGVGVEDLFYEGTKPQSAASIAERSANLDKITAAGKPVLVIDYVDDATGYQGANQLRVDDFWTKTLLAGYTPQVSFTDSSILGEDPINQLKIASGNVARPLPAVNQTPLPITVPIPQEVMLLPAQPDILTDTDNTASRTGNQVINPVIDVITGNLAPETIAAKDFESEDFDQDSPNDDQPGIIQYKSMDVFPRRQRSDFSLVDSEDLLRPDRNTCRNFGENSGDLQAKPLFLDIPDLLI